MAFPLILICASHFPLCQSIADAALFPALSMWYLDTPGAVLAQAGNTSTCAKEAENRNILGVIAPDRPSGRHWRSARPAGRTAMVCIRLAILRHPVLCGCGTALHRKATTIHSNITRMDTLGCQRAWIEGSEDFKRPSRHRIGCSCRGGGPTNVDGLWEEPKGLTRN